jgi:GxxExxY protein
MSPEEMNQITEKIIGCAFKVGHTLGVGFLEKVYENALAHELRKAGLRVEQQKPILTVSLWELMMQISWSRRRFCSN